MTRNEETIELIYKDESYAIIGACFEVYKDKAAVSMSRFITSVWKSSWNSNGFRFSQSHRKRCNIAVALWCKTLIRDFICYDKVILEIKAVSQLIDEHRAQVLNYLPQRTASQA
jgi:GxxExxY protein